MTVGDDAYTAAGSVITEDVPDGALAIARGQRQGNIEGYAERRERRLDDDSEGNLYTPRELSAIDTSSGHRERACRSITTSG